MAGLAAHRNLLTSLILLVCLCCVQIIGFGGHAAADLSHALGAAASPCDHASASVCTPDSHQPHSGHHHHEGDCCGPPHSHALGDCPGEITLPLPAVSQLAPCEPLAFLPEVFLDRFIPPQLA